MLSPALEQAQGSARRPACPAELVEGGEWEMSSEIGGSGVEAGRGKGGGGGIGLDLADHWKELCFYSEWSWDPQNAPGRGVACLTLCFKVLCWSLS